MHYAAFQNHSFFRTPAWRWERVLALIDRFPMPGRCGRHDDDFVRQARTFALRQRAADGDPTAAALLWFEQPDLYYAYEFYQRLADQPEAAMFLEARLLAGQSFETIADVMGITPGTVKWFEALFFNVADRLKRRDWITSQVLLPALKGCPPIQARDPFQGQDVVKPLLDGSVKMFAYFGGPHVVDVMLSGFKVGAPVTAPDDLNAWFDRQWAVTIRRRSVQAEMRFEINRYNVTDLFAVHAKIVETDRSEDAGAAGQTTHEKTLKALLDQIPFAAGDDGGQPHRGTVLPRLDAMAAELTDDEVLAIAAGHPVSDIDQDWPQALPPPRDRPGTFAHEDAIN
jgi:hypothetical protein